MERIINLLQIVAAIACVLTAPGGGPDGPPGGPGLDPAEQVENPVINDTRPHRNTYTSTAAWSDG